MLASLLRRLEWCLDWFGEIAAGALFAAYAVVAVGGLAIGVLAAFGWI